MSLIIRNTTVLPGKNKKGILERILSDPQLFLMSLPGVAFFIIFSYFPLYGILIAFKDYNIRDGILGSPWNGFKNFEFYFKSDFFWRTTFNTIYLNFLFISVGVILAATLAILLNEIRSGLMKRIFQSAMFFPYFLSWIVISSFVYNFLSQDYGSLNAVLKSLGLEPVAWYSKAEIWRGILTFINTWQSVGYSIIIYMATIVSIDVGIIEAARIDGANKLQEILYITIPYLIPTIIIMVLLAIGRIFYGNFDMIYNIIQDNGVLMPMTDIIDTYVFRGMRVQGEFGMATAVGLYQSVLGCILVIISNKLAKLYDKNAGLF